MWTVPIASLAAQCWPQLPHHRGFTMTDTPQSVGVLCRIDQPVAETATWKHTRDRHPCPGGIRTRNPSKRADEDLRLRQSCHWDRQMCLLQLKMDNTIMYIVKLLSGMTCLFIIDNYNLLFIWDQLYIYIYIHTESKTKVEALCLDTMRVSVVKIFLVPPSCASVPVCNFLKWRGCTDAAPYFGTWLWCSSRSHFDLREPAYCIERLLTSKQQTVL